MAVIRTQEDLAVDRENRRIAVQVALEYVNGAGSASSTSMYVGDLIKVAEQVYAFLSESDKK